MTEAARKAEAVMRASIRPAVMKTEVAYFAFTNVCGHKLPNSPHMVPVLHCHWMRTLEFATHSLN